MVLRVCWKRVNWLAVAGIATALYTVAVGYTLGWSRTWTFLMTEPDLNEIGDFLAGALAPIALVWLVAAVFTQRQELNETRAQFEENQKVVDAQLKTINAQNALLSLQHHQAGENAKKAYKLSLFDKRFEIYENFIAFDYEHDPDQPSAKDYDESSYRTMVHLSHQASFVFDSAIADWLWSISVQIDDYMTYKATTPFEMGDDGHGNITVLNNTENQHIRTLRSARRDAIRDQFDAANRIEKFWRYLDVSDQPLVAG